MLKEDIEKASASADFLRNELKSAYNRACESNPVLAILLFDLITESAKINNRIQEIQSVLPYKE